MEEVEEDVDTLSSIESLVCIEVLIRVVSASIVVEVLFLEWVEDGV